MSKSRLLLSLMTASCMLSANAKAPAELTDADWLSAAKAALTLTSQGGAFIIVVDDGMLPEARNALESLQKVVAIANVPDRNPALSASGDYKRILQFRPQGDRIELLAGSVYPKVYTAGDCRVTTHLFLARTADGEWKQDGPTKIHMCSRR